MNISLKNNPRLIFTPDSLSIDKELTLYSCNKEEKKFDLGSFGLNTLTEEGFIPDDFCHEQYLLIRERGKEILISGCSHKGILDIVRWFSPDVLVGGFHFSKLPLDTTLAEYAKILNKNKTKFYTCHCTGLDQYDFMKSYMDNLSYLQTGETITL